MEVYDLSRPPELHDAVALMEQYAHTPMDFADATLVLMAEALQLEAVALDDSLAETHAALGLVRMASFDFVAAEEHLKRAIELRPEVPRAREWLVTVYLWSGRRAAALDEAERLGVDSVSATATAEIARALAADGRCDEALTRLERLEELERLLVRGVDPACPACRSALHDTGSHHPPASRSFAL